jgi:hypothetical protein
MTYRPRDPGTVGVVVDYLRSSGDEVVPLGAGAYRFNGARLPLDELVAIANTRRRRLDLGRLVVAETHRLAALASFEIVDHDDRPWLDDALDELARLWRAGWSARDIGAALGRTNKAIITRASTLDLPRRRFAKAGLAGRRAEPLCLVISR